MLQASRALVMIEDPLLSGKRTSGRREGWKDRLSAKEPGKGQILGRPCIGGECQPTASSDGRGSPLSMTPAGIQYLELAGDRDRYNAWVGANKVPVKWTRRPGPQGIVSVVINTVEGPSIVLHEGKIY